MFSKTILFLTLSLVVTALHGYQTIYSERTIQGDAKAALAQATGIINKEITRATTSIKDSLNNLKSFAKASESTALSLLQTTVATNLKEIQDAVTNAELHGLDATSCINNKDEQMKDSVAIINNNITDLVQKNLTEADKIRTTAETNIKSLSKNIEKLQTKLTGCAVGIPGLICYTEVIAEATKLQADVPSKVDSLEIKAINDLDTIKGKVIDSTYVLANDAQITISLTTQEITQCINELQLASRFILFKRNH